MKKSTLLTVCVALIVAITTLSFKSDKKQNDPKLVGIWKGFEIDKQFENTEKHWIQQRFKNGKYVILFTTKEGCDVKTFTENGRWWTKDGKFFEANEGSEDIDEYYYTVTSPEVVEFKSIILSGKATDTYIFSDYKMDLD